MTILGGTVAMPGLSDESAMVWLAGAGADRFTKTNSLAPCCIVKVPGVKLSDPPTVTV
jgi:hypothetical protein